jgi:adenylate cyclase
MAARLGMIGADPRDDEDLRQKKALLVLIAVLILPVDVVWGAFYLAFGSPVGILSFVYLAVSVGSLLVFAKTRSFIPFLVTQLLDVLLAPALAQMVSGGFLPVGGVGLWGVLAPLGALVFLEVRKAIGWFIGFVATFVLLGIVGELFFPDADVPAWFTTTMLAMNVIGSASVAFTLLASFANQRNVALRALRAEQEKSEALLVNILPSSIVERLKATTQTIADHFESASVIFADVVDLTPLSERLPAAEVVGMLDQLFSRFDVLAERHGLEKIKTIGDCYMGAAGVPDPS